MGRHTRTQRMIAEARDYLEKSREDNVRAGYPPSAHSISFLYTQLSSQRVRKLNGKEAVVDESRSGWRAFKKAMNDACEEGIIPKDWIGPETQRSPRESGTSQ